MLVNGKGWIPEMDAFDHVEVDANHALNPCQPLSLLGALLIAAGSATQTQVAACVGAQADHDPDAALGELVVRQGFISRQTLEHALRAQDELKSSLLARIELHICAR